MSPQNLRNPHDDWTFRNIVHISHGDTFRSLNLKLPRLRKLGPAIADGDWKGAYELWDRYFRLEKKHLDFFDPGDYKTLVSANPREMARLRKEAGEICRHRINWYGPRVEQFGDIVNFDPGEDRSAIYGFHYWYWSYPLLFSYALDPDPKYAEAFDRLFNQWYDQRDSVSWRISNMDPIWYELGLCRTNVFIAFYSLFRNEPALCALTRERLLRTLLGHGRALFEYVNRKGTPGNNSQFNAVLALAHLSLAMPEFKESKRWIRQTLKSLNRHLQNAVYPDGGFAERCPSYASFSLGFATEVYRLLADSSEYAAERKKLEPLLHRAYEWYMYIITPLAEFPPFGDARTRSAVPMLSGGIAALDLDVLHAVLSPNLSRIAREKLPTQYNHRARQFDLLKRTADPSHLPAETSVHLTKSHWTVMRTGWKPTDHYMAINHGPIAGHAHREALSFNCYAFGEPQALELDLAVERGYDDPRCDFAQSSRSHNMLVLDNESIESTRNPPDLWTGQDVIWHSDDEFDYFQAWHRGYERTKGAVVTRKICFVKPYFWVVHDRVTARTNCTSRSASSYLHACNPFVARGSQWVSSGRKSRLNVVPLTTRNKVETGLDNRMKLKHDSIEFGFYRNYYPNRYFISFSQRIKAGESQDICALLYPRRKSDRTRIRVENLPVRRKGRKMKPQTGQAWRIHHGKQCQMLFLNHDPVVKECTVEGQPIFARAAVLNEKMNRWSMVE